MQGLYSCMCRLTPSADLTAIQTTRIAEPMQQPVLPHSTCIKSSECLVSPENSIRPFWLEVPGSQKHTPTIDSQPDRSLVAGGVESNHPGTVTYYSLVPASSRCRAQTPDVFKRRRASRAGHASRLVPGARDALLKTIRSKRLDGFRLPEESWRKAV